MIAARPGSTERRGEGTEEVDAWVWIVIAVAVIVVGVFLYALWESVQRRRIERHRAQAQDLRREASAGFGHAKERESLAEEQAARAREERVAAQRATEIDPDTD
jgi:hypothetical protein